MKDIVKSQANDEYKVINGKRVRVTRRKRRSNLITYCALAVAICTALGLVISLCFLFDLEEVRLSGLTLYSSDQILAAGGVEAGANLIRTNTSVIEQRLMDTLPYLKSVTVNKDYPNAIDIDIVEEVKRADIESNGQFYVVSDTGKILEVGNSVHDVSLPLVKGFQLKEPELGKDMESEDELKSKVLLQLFEAIDKSGLDKITEIDITERSDILLCYDNRITINPGSSMDLEYKLTCMRYVINDKISSTFEGTLKYNGANSGISAILKGAQTTTAASRTAAPETEVPAAQPSEEQNVQTTADNGYTGWQTNENLQ